MFVNKINGVPNIGFKGYQHVKNDVGETVMSFYYPYDSSKETCEIQFFRATPTNKFNHKIDEKPLATVQLKSEGGTEVNLQDITNLDKDAPFAYKVVRKDKATGKVIWEGADTGMKVKNENGELVHRVDVDSKVVKEKRDANGGLINVYEDYRDSIDNYKYTLVSRKGTTPTVQGSGYLVTPDSFMPGVMYRGFTEENTGELYYDKDIQKNMEAVPKNFSNVYGGSAAGLQYKMPYFKENGYTSLFSTPMANGSGAWSLGYWNKNNLQPSPNMGNLENFSSFFGDLYKNGMKYVFDVTATSEGLEGIHFQYAQRWIDKTPQSYYWFRMPNAKDASLGYGIMPKNPEVAGLRFINAPKIFERQSDGTYAKKVNPDFNPNRETFGQVYDKQQASERQIKEYDRAIVNYENLLHGNELDINSHDDTLINYALRINNFKEVEKNIDTINSLIKDGHNIDLESPEGIMMALSLSDFHIDRKTEGGFVTWDANTDLVKMNYHISGYDEKQLQSIVSLSERNYERQMIERGTKEVQDMAVQVGKYWTGKVKNIQTIYTAQTIGNAKTTEDIEKLINEGKLPKEVQLSSAALTNVLNGNYQLSPKGTLIKDDTTVKSLMKLPLDSLEFGENTVGVLSTSYFSNRATTDETIGVSRFDLMKQNNPHLVEPYAKNYKKVNNLFKNEIKNFADSVIEKVNSSSSEKLLDSNGNYTEYGEYVIELMGQDITKYAFLKALDGDKLNTKLLKNGEITYDYNKLKEDTSLKALNINASSPTEEAQILTAKIEKGLKRLSADDIKYVADSISKRITNTDTSSFRIAEAMVDKAGLGLDWRLDASKDVIDMDAIRNGDNSFDDNWDKVINFQTKFTQAVKSENPNSYIVAEITDIEDLMKDTYGAKSSPYGGVTNIGQKFNGEPDAFAKFFTQTGITSEAGYSYFFTNLLNCFSPDFERGVGANERHDGFKDRLDIMMQTRSVDYIRNLYTFMGNHDKPRMIHGLALDMELFHANLLNDWNNFSMGHKYREDAIKVLSGAKTNAEIPIELRLNVDNNNYFLTESSRAIAMSKLLMNVVNDKLGNTTSEENKKLITNALVDLANGNYLGKGTTEKLEKIQIKELSTLNSAFEEVLNLASGLNLSDTEKRNLIDAVVKQANQKDLTNYLVHGDLDWNTLPQEIKDSNEKYAAEILGTSGNHSKYSLYTVQMARLLRDAYKETKLNPTAENAINNGLKEFVQKYDRQTILENSKEFKKIEDTKTAMKKNGYAARDIKMAAAMAVKQAEFTSGKTIADKENLIATIYQLATEPAVEKATMIMEFLKGLPGIPTMYGGDELGMTGYEEKAKNIYLQNRNALPWTEIEGDSTIAKYRKTVMQAMNDTLKDRSNSELEPLNNGTPYELDLQINSKNRAEIKFRINQINDELNKLSPNDAGRASLEDERRMLTKELAKVAYMMQNAKGDITVSLFNAGDVDFANDKKQNIKSSALDMILLGTGVALPAGTIFTNAMSKDKAEYVVKEVGGKQAIVRKDGKKIIMDSMTSKNGVMILKHIKNIIFKGAPKKVYYNPQYNFASNPYKKQEIAEEGQKLSIIAL